MRLALSLVDHAPSTPPHLCIPKGSILNLMVSDTFTEILYKEKGETSSHVLFGLLWVIVPAFRHDDNMCLKAQPAYY